MENQSLLYQVLLTFTNGFKEHREDISAVALTPEKHLWLGTDETSTVERLDWVSANHFAEHKRFRFAEFIDLPAPEEEEIDIEGIDYRDRYLWIVGSHSWKRKKPQTEKTDLKNIQRLTKVVSEPNRYILGRIPVVNGELKKSCPHPHQPNVQLTAAKLELTKKGNLLTEALADDPHLGLFVKAEIPGKENGFDIEGIAVYHNRIFLGLRGPVLRGWALMLEIEVESSQAGLLKLRKITPEGREYKKHFIFLNGLGIRDLCIDGEDILILAGPTMDLDGPVQLYRLLNGIHLQENVLNTPLLVQEIPYGNRDDRAEGMTLFQDISGVPSLLVVYDSPAKTRLVDDSGVVADVFRLMS
jgi:hypothetical protein